MKYFVTSANRISEDRASSSLRIFDSVARVDDECQRFRVIYLGFAPLHISCLFYPLHAIVAQEVLLKCGGDVMISRIYMNGFLFLRGARLFGLSLLFFL